MQPGFDLRIRTMIKALSETVMPAVDPASKAAVEQLHIVIGSLELMREQIDYAHWYEVVDGRSLIALAERFAKEAGQPLGAEVDAAMAAVREAVTRHDLTLDEQREANRQLREAVCNAIEGVLGRSDPAAAQRLTATVLDFSEEQIGRERAYVAKTNFEVFPDTLKTIRDSLTTSPY